MAERHRINQHEKSRQMKMRLIGATLDCLQAHGFHGASLSRILDHAGVSRGAWRHHFESKNDLVAASAEYLFSTALARAHTVADELSSRQSDFLDIIESIWENFYQGPYRDVWVEFNVACRTDEELALRLTPVITSFFDDLDRIWNTRLAHLVQAGLNPEVIMNLSLYLLRGLSFQSVSMNTPEHYRTMRNEWIGMLKRLL